MTMGFKWPEDMADEFIKEFLAKILEKNNSKRCNKKIDETLNFDVELIYRN